MGRFCQHTHFLTYLTLVLTTFPTGDIFFEAGEQCSNNVAGLTVDEMILHQKTRRPSTVSTLL
jgi:hypothetical protein